MQPVKKHFRQRLSLLKEKPYEITQRHQNFTVIIDVKNTGSVIHQMSSLTHSLLRKVTTKER